MSRIDAIFSRLNAEGRTALMPFITGGYPTRSTTASVIRALETAGASVVEIGIPFSDPIADGPVIASSMHEALQQGVTPDVVFDIVRQVRSETQLGLVAMVSHSIVHRRGTEQFVTEAAAAGFDGLIVPDVDLMAALPLAQHTAQQGLSLSLLIAPTTSEPRMQQLAELCSGFVYLLARDGITGERDEAPDLVRSVAAVRQFTDLPLAAGFGISSPQHVTAVTAAADAAIVGSALVRRMGQADDPVGAASRFAAELAEGLTRR